MTTYHVKNGGNDTADGLSDANAWATIAKVNGETFAAGDVVQFNRGDTWREELITPSSGSDGNPITFAAYGSGNLPIIRGDDAISGFTSRSTGNQWTADGNTLGLWRFNGDLTDESANGNDLTEVNTPAYMTDPWDLALDDPSSNGYARSSSADFVPGTNSFSVEVRFRIPPQGAGSTDTYLVSKRVSSFDNAILMWLDDNASRLGSRIHDGTNNFQNFNVPTNDIDDGEWHTFSIVVDRSAETFKAFFDQEEIANRDITGFGSLDPTEDLFIGALAAGASVTNADIAEVRWMSTAITPSAAPAADLWEADCTVEPNVAFFDTTLGTKRSSQDAVQGSTEYWFDSSNNKLVVGGSTDPDTAFSTVEIGQRDSCITQIGKAHITYTNLNLRRSNQATGGNLKVEGSYSGVTVQALQTSEAANSGMSFGTADAGGILVENCTSEDNTGGQGIYLAGDSTETDKVVRDNTCSRNLQSGMFIAGNHWTIEGNLCDANGHYDPDIVNSMGINVFANDNPGTQGFRNIIRYNVCRNTKTSRPDGQGIMLDQGANENEVYYNISYGNDGAGIATWDSDANEIYNNVCWGNMVDTAGTAATFGNYGEIRIRGASANTVVKNNIAVATEADTPAVHVDASSETAGGHVFENNCWWRASGDWWEFGASSGATLSGWQTASGSGTDDINADPQLIDPENADFRLHLSSPCRDRGQDVGLTQDYNAVPLPRGHAPDMGAHELPPPLATSGALGIGI